MNEALPALSGDSNDLSAAPPVVLQQKRFSSRTRFELGEDGFRYELKTDDATRSFRLDYAELSTDRESLTERQTWWRNVGLIWIAIGLFIAVSAFIEDKTVRLPIWLWLGAACYAWYQIRVVRYQIIPAERCNVLVIEDGSAYKIIAELERRRTAQLRQRYDYLTPHEHPQQQRQRIQWLQRQGALDANEVSARMLQLEAMEAAYAQARQAEEDDQD